MKREKQKQALVNLFLSGMMGIGQVIDEAYNIADSIPNWIAVDDEKPTIGEKVLMYAPDIDEVIVGAYQRTGNWWSEDYGCHFAHITHWMPLPTPPKKGE